MEPFIIYVWHGSKDLGSYESYVLPLTNDIYPFICFNGTQYKVIRRRLHTTKDMMHCISIDVAPSFPELFEAEEEARRIEAEEKRISEWELSEAEKELFINSNLS